jgi:hypothetical protein
VWACDGHQCAFVGADGRCQERASLELHHVVPFADGGATSVEIYNCAVERTMRTKRLSGSVRSTFGSRQASGLVLDRVQRRSSGGSPASGDDTSLSAFCRAGMSMR